MKKRFLRNLSRDGGYENYALAAEACARIHAFLTANLPGYTADKWSDPIPRADLPPDDPGQSWLVPIDLENRAQFVEIPAGEASDIAARLLPEDFDVSRWFAQSD